MTENDIGADELQNAASAVEAAQYNFEAADTEYRQASSNRTCALNELNVAQKRFSDLVRKLVDSAPRGSDWARKGANG